MDNLNFSLYLNTSLYSALLTTGIQTNMLYMQTTTGKENSNKYFLFPPQPLHFVESLINNARIIVI